MPDLTERIRDAAAELPPTQQEMVLEFIQGLNRSLRDEEVAIGEAGAKLAVGAWPADDFSDWLAQSPPKRREGGE